MEAGGGGVRQTFGLRPDRNLDSRQVGFSTTAAAAAAATISTTTTATTTLTMDSRQVGFPAQARVRATSAQITHMRSLALARTSMYIQAEAEAEVHVLEEKFVLEMTYTILLLRLRRLLLLLPMLECVFLRRNSLTVPARPDVKEAMRTF